TANAGGGTPPYTVSFYTNGQLIGSVSSSPITTNLGVLPVGSYTSYVHAVDSSVPAQQADSTTNVFTILPNPVVVTLTSPTTGQTVTAGTNVTLAATATVGAPLTISGLQFYVDGVSAGIDTTAPYSVAATVTAGNHAVYVQAIDSLNRRIYSATNQITATPPTVTSNNNNFANAIPLAGPIVTTTGSNVGANKEFFEPNHGGNRGGASVWWTWTATASGQTTIDTMGSDFNTLLGVYTGDAVNALTAIAGNDDDSGNVWS